MSVLAYIIILLKFILFLTQIDQSFIFRYFLVLDVCSTRRIPQPLTENNEMSNHNRNKLETLRECRQMKKLPKHSVAWIKQKKQRARDQMKEVARDSKYTGRKRRAKF